MGLNRINDFKQELNITNFELSKMSGVPKSTIDKITSGKTRNPNIETIKSIVYSMGKTLDDLSDSAPLASGNDAGADLYTAHEKEIIKKYRAIDERGRENINIALDTEYMRSPEYLAAKKENLA